MSVLAGETVLMRVYLNHADVGELFFLLEGKSPLFTRGALQSIGLVNMPGHSGAGFDGGEYISLDALAPALSYRIDEYQAELHIQAPSEYFQMHVMDQPGFGAPAGLRFASQASAFLNYGIDLSYQGASGRTSLNVPLEMVAHKGRVSAYSNFLYTNDERDSRLARLMTSATFDFRDAMTRLTLGDYVASGGRDGGGGIYGGVSYSRVFSINPYFNRYTGLLVNGTVNSPSQVEYYLGDRLLISEQVPPGQFVFRDMVPPAGAHQARLVITDALGNSTATSGDIYFASRLLKPGVQEFSYNLGFRRENLGQENWHYENATALGFHRYGLNRDLTLGARFELDKDVANVGSEAQFRISDFGQANVRLSASSADSESGYAASADYQYFSTSFHVSVQVRAMSEHYANVSLEPGLDKPRFEWQLGLGINSWVWGSLSAAFADRQSHGGYQSTRALLAWSKRLGRFGTLLARYQRMSGDGEDRQVYVGINRPFGFGQLAALEYRSNRFTDLLSARISKSRALRPGWGYDLNLGLESGHSSALLSAEYGGAHGVYSAGYRRIRGEDAYRVGTAGGVSWTGGGVFFSRPVGNSFALVEVEDLAGVDVLLNNQFIGQTNRAGQLLVPNLNPYYGNRLSINDRDIPINYELPDMEHIIATPFRGGGEVSFKAQKRQAFSGILNTISNGKTQPAEYWGLQYSVDGNVIETVVGKSGVFYFENTPAGPLPVEIFSGDRHCSLVLEIPDADEMYVDLGEFDCELSN